LPILKDYLEFGVKYGNDFSVHRIGTRRSFFAGLFCCSIWLCLFWQIRAFAWALSVWGVFTLATVFYAPGPLGLFDNVAKGVVLAVWTAYAGCALIAIGFYTAQNDDHLTNWLTRRTLYWAGGVYLIFSYSLVSFIPYYLGVDEFGFRLTENLVYFLFIVWVVTKHSATVRAFFRRLRKKPSDLDYAEDPGDEPMLIFNYLALIWLLFVVRNTGVLLVEQGILEVAPSQLHYLKGLQYEFVYFGAIAAAVHFLVTRVLRRFDGAWLSPLRYSLFFVSTCTLLFWAYLDVPRGFLGKPLGEPIRESIYLPKNDSYWDERRDELQRKLHLHTKDHASKSVEMWLINQIDADQSCEKKGDVYIPRLWPFNPSFYAINYTTGYGTYAFHKSMRSLGYSESDLPRDWAQLYAENERSERYARIEARNLRAKANKGFGIINLLYRSTYGEDAQRAEQVARWVERPICQRDVRNLNADPTDVIEKMIKDVPKEDRNYYRVYLHHRAREITQMANAGLAMFRREIEERKTWMREQCEPAWDIRYSRKVRYDCRRNHKVSLRRYYSYSWPREFRNRDNELSFAYIFPYRPFFDPENPPSYSDQE
jgi:hypothetical protein